MRRLLPLLVLAWGSLAAAAPQVWVTHATVKIRPTDAPGTGTQAQIAAAGNEFEAFQVAVHGGNSGAVAVSMSAPTLTGPGGATIPAANVRLYREEYLTTQYASNSEVSVGDWPDALIPDVDELFNEKRNAFPFDVPAGVNRVVWVEVLVPDHQAPGSYTGTLEVVANGFSAQVPVSLLVRSFSLPSTASLPSTFGLGWSDPCVASYPAGYSDPACGDVGLTQLRVEWTQFFLDHRISVDPVYTGPAASGAGFDWASWDGSYAPLFDGSTRTRLQGAQVTAIPFNWTKDGAHFAAWAQHFKQRGWFNKTFDYTCDEPPNGCAYSDIPGRVAVVRAGDPAFKTLVTTNIDSAIDGGVLADITWMTPVIDQMDARPTSTPPGNQRANYDRYVQGGNTLFWYQSCDSIGCSQSTGAKTFDPSATGWPSMMVDAPAMRNRAMEWLSYLNRMQGELYYATGIAFERGADPYANQYFFGGNGDGTLVYPGRPSRIGGTTPIPVASMRLKLIREGMEDYEYLKLCSDLGDPQFARNQAVTVTPSAYTVNDDPAAMYAARSALAARIESLQGSSTACSDGTAANACSTALPARCVGGALVPSCASCGCPGGTVCLGDGTCGTAPPPGYSVSRVARTPVIDGQFPEYERMPQLSVGGSSVSAGWDDQNLYLAYDVVDAQLHAAAPDAGPASLFASDAVELMIDPTGNGGQSADADDLHVVIDVAGTIAVSRGWTSYTSTLGAQRAVDLEGGTLGGAATGRGYRVELAVPWSALGLTPQEGMTFGFDVAIDDVDAAGALTSTDWRGLNRFNNPAGWGQATLAPVVAGTSTGSTGTTTGTTTGSTSGGAGSTGQSTTGTAGAGGSTGTGHPRVSSSCSSVGGDAWTFLPLLGLRRRRRRR
jgi:hypothetical protein